MVKTFCLRWFWVCMAVFAAQVGMARAEDKSYVSEIARNKVGLAVVYSGAETLPAARDFANAVMAANPKEKTAANVALVPADKFAGSAPIGMTYVFMLIGDECGEAFTPGVSAAMPAEVGTPQCSMSVFKSRLTSDVKKAGALSIVLFAPDASRFAVLNSDFLGRRFGSEFRPMGNVSRVIETNKVLLFSTPEVRPITAGWGQRRQLGDSGPARGASNTREIVDIIEWHDIAECDALAPEAFKEASEAFFLDRSQPTPLPTAARSALQASNVGENLPPLSILSLRATVAGRGCAVFMAPNATLLAGRVGQFPQLEALPGGPQIARAVDLRNVGRTVLLINGDAPKEERDAVRLLLAKDMRQRLGMVIDERGGEFFQVLEQEDALRMLLGDVKTREAARKQTRSNYVWMFTLAEYAGTTQYENNETCLTAPPAPFNEAEPARPGDRVSTGLFHSRPKTPDEMARDMETWKQQCNAWQRRRDESDDRISHMDFQWRRIVTANESASARGVLRLVNLADKGEVVWEQEVDGRSSRSRQYSSDTVSVRGRDGRPSSLNSPESRLACANEVMRNAAREAGNNGLNRLLVTALISGGPSDTPTSGPEGKTTPEALTPVKGEVKPLPGDTESAPLPPPSSPSTGPKVAAIIGKTAVLTIGTKQGVKFNDLVVVALETMPVTDPDTGKVLDYKVIDRLTLRVVGGNATAECVPNTPADEAKWDKMKAGLSVTWQPKKAPAKPTP